MLRVMVKTVYRAATSTITSSVTNCPLCQDATRVTCCEKQRYNGI